MFTEVSPVRIHVQIVKSYQEKSYQDLTTKLETKTKTLIPRFCGAVLDCHLNLKVMQILCIQDCWRNSLQQIP